MKKNKTIINIFTILLLFITSIIISASIYIKLNFANQNADEMVYYLFNGLNGTSTDVIVHAIALSLVPFLFLFLFLLIPFIRLQKRKYMIDVKIKNKKYCFTILPNKFLYKYRIIYSSTVLLVSLVLSYNMLGLHEYIKRITNYSSIIDDNYVNPADVSITFPNEKRNLIILYLESTENTFIDKENGGGWGYSVIPELASIAKENINFSNSDKIGGALFAPGTQWTVAGLVSTTSGIPLKIPIDGNEYTSSNNFLVGAYTLGDLLHKEGYNLEAMFGSDATFGGRSNYYLRHGNYKIFDVNTAINEGKMSEDEKVWWGFDDTHLFDWAKEEITNLANSDKPFSFSFLTANTHFTDGYMESAAENLYKSQYENVFAYSSKQVNDFVEWLKQQDFYENTTLVIMGDHHSMQDPKYFESHMYKGYERTIYNAIINSAIEPINSKNRLFSSMDMYPTILASIDVKIEGDRLGIGTNLFSNRKTLAEEQGILNLNDELAKNSKFYNDKILKDDYLDLIKAKK
ncbi:LTA synthase family protein [Neobacillus rhizophilus]|uniref:LTA synthase family protein n=1 Tax=Neobacillus rhizophilus TaxID=2833579 RepID=A0A942U224_9BACI|nr:LTA synthase family protein [Neobacillus rhizophilus]MBS4213130.1 LTA synthase family protein [Neobacillus rhizophilus]MBU8914747.1 LTA synthase family protein [Bacillus sp. FJAT-29953]